MRIVQINAVAATSSTGRTNKEIHNALKKCGHQSWIAAPDALDTSESIKIGNSIDRRIHGLYSRVFGRQGYASRCSTQRLIKRLDEIKPDVVHLSNLHGNYINLPILLTYLAEKNIAVVITLHDCWFFTGHCCHFIGSNCDKWKNGCGKCPEIRNWNKSWFFDRSHANLEDKKKLFGRINNLAVIGVSKWVTSFVGDSILKNARIIRTIYNWIDTDIFYPRDVKSLRKKYAAENEKIILGVSQLWGKQKGLDDFITLAGILPEYKIILVGGIDSTIQLPQNIITVGTTDNVNQLAEYYSLADVFFNPTRRETFGKVTAEALACGTPVVAYNATATPELVPQQCGELVEIGDVEEAANQIKSVLSRKNININCRNFVLETFKKDILIHKMMVLYSEISGVDTQL